MIQVEETNSGPAIELTPIIDMVFLLLIFFLIATTFHQTEREMQIVLPYSASAGPISTALREIVINVDTEGNIIVSGTRITEDDLASLIAEAVAGNPEQKVTVRGDRQTAYANVFRVLDICKGNGVQDPYLDAVLPEASP